MTVADVAAVSPEELQNMPGFGPATVKLIVSALRQGGPENAMINTN
jgi:DNA uptake protein ComE-like DNA-binding protein